MRRFSWFNVTSLTLGFAFLYLPMVILVIYSFNASQLVTVWGGFSTRWYGELLRDEAFCSGSIDTGLVARRQAALSETTPPSPRAVAATGSSAAATAASELLGCAASELNEALTTRTIAAGGELCPPNLTCGNTNS